MEHRGHVLKSTGDGLLATFDAASDALTAAVVA
jgi:class 3 adenylate cyclase